MSTPKSNPPVVETAPKVDRKLPPHELTARRRRKRNLNRLPNVDLTGQPIHVAMPQVAQPSPLPDAEPGSLATREPLSDFS